MIPTLQIYVFALENSIHSRLLIHLRVSRLLSKTKNGLGNPAPPVLRFLGFKEFMDRFWVSRMLVSKSPPQEPYLLIITLKLSPFYHVLFFAIQRNQK